MRGGHSRGRGGGGRGGRGRGRGRGDKSSSAAREEDDESAEPSTGDKRKRVVEPDGAPGTGIRGNHAPPTIQTTKKVKTNDGEATPTSAS